jgi:hypothetical protein
VVVTIAPQSSPTLGRLPAFLAIAVVLASSPVEGQAPVRLAREARVYKAPGGPSLGSLLAGAEVVPGRVSGSAVEVRLDGWIISSSLGAFDRDGFNIAINKRPTENLRATPKGTAVGRLVNGTGFTRTESRDNWTRVRRTVWIDAAAIEHSGGTVISPSAGPGLAERAELVLRAPLALTPGGDTVGSVDSGTVARLLTRSGGWTRVQFEAWIPDSTLATAPAGVIIGVSQAEVQANPARFVGQVVQWRVQFIALQKADELRPEIPTGAMYLLTRGPLPEPGFVYVTIPTSMVAQFEATPALKELTIRGTIRSATTKYLPTPVVELINVVQ